MGFFYLKFALIYNINKLFKRLLTLQISHPLTGSMVALITPMYENGEVDFDALEKLVISILNLELRQLYRLEQQESLQHLIMTSILKS